MIHANPSLRSQVSHHLDAHAASVVPNGLVFNNPYLVLCHVCSSHGSPGGIKSLHGCLDINYLVSAFLQSIKHPIKLKETQDNSLKNE